jgi:ketosteroid isomerase-like protein
VSDSLNVVLLRRAVDAFNRRDLDAALALHDPGVEFTPYERVAEGLGPYRGHDGVRAWFGSAVRAIENRQEQARRLDDRGTRFVP